MDSSNITAASGSDNDARTDVVEQSGDSSDKVSIDSCKDGNATNCASGIHRDERPSAAGRIGSSSSMMRGLSGSLRLARRLSSSAASGVKSAVQAGTDSARAGADATMKMAQTTAFVQEAFTGQDDEEETQISKDDAEEHQSIVKVREAIGEDHCDILPDEFLRKCLAQHYGHVDKAAEVARGFISFRSSAKWPFRIPCQDVEIPLRTGMHWLLPMQRECQRVTWMGGGGDDEGPAACLVYNAAKLDPAVCPISEYQKMGSFLMERATDDLAAQKRGVALIVDSAAVEFLSMLKIMSLQDMKRGVLMWKGAFPCRLRRIWVVDAPLGSGTFAKAILSLLAPKVQERICFARRASDKGLTPLFEDLGGLFQLPPSLGGDEEWDWNAIVANLISQDTEQEHTEVCSGIAEEAKNTEEAQERAPEVGT